MSKDLKRVSNILLYLCLIQLFVSCTTTIILAQHSSHKSVPFYLSYSVKGATKYLCKNAETDTEKARALYGWITHNIKFDKKRWRQYGNKKYSASRIMRRRKAIAHDYSTLFMRMCKIANIPVLEVQGYGKEKASGYVPAQKFYWEQYVWDAVQVGGEWQLIDVPSGSGGFKLKPRKVRKFLFKTLGIPYVMNKYKFVRSPSEDFFLTPPELLLEYNMSVNPIFQMRNNPIPICRFEQLCADSISGKTKLDFKTELNNLRDKSYTDCALTNAEKGYEFNKKNHHIVGFTYAAYGKALIESLPRKKAWVNSSSQLVVCDQAIKYNTAAISYLEKFKNDNAIVHKTITDSIANRDNLIIFNDQSFYKTNNSIWIKNKRGIGQMQLRIKIYRKNIKKLSHLYGKKTNDHLYNVRRNTDPKKVNSGLIKKWSLKIEENNKKIATFSDTIIRKTGNIEAYIDTLNMWGDSANNTYKINAQQIQKNMSQNINTQQTLSELKVNYLLIVQNKNSRDQYMRKIEIKLHRPLSGNQKEKYTSLNMIIRLISENKKNISLIKKMNVNDEGEDELYFVENERLSKIYNETLEYYSELIRIASITQHYMKKENRAIRKENKLVKRDIKVQAVSERGETKAENGKYIRFNRQADEAILGCRRYLFIAKNRIADLKKE